MSLNLRQLNRLSMQALRNDSLLDHGKYKIVKILGQGGFGITYLAIDLGLDKLRAIKEFFPKDYCDRNETTSQVTLGTSNTAEFVDKLKKKFIKEARNIANLDQHPGIITIHAVFEENNTAYYVMDYIEGQNLSEIVKRNGPLSVDKAIKYITEVGKALEYVHTNHINHLDIKPANIMIREKDDVPLLIDFGLSKQYDSEGLQTSTTPTGISHGYAPFEQYKEGGVKEFSPQTDVYSLAATLYFLISGKVPPHATDMIEQELMFPEGFPYYLKAPISKAMSMKRQNRHESIRDFINSLDIKDEETEIELPNFTSSQVTYNDKPKEKTIKIKENNKAKGSLRISNTGIVISIVVFIGLILVCIPFTNNKQSNTADLEPAPVEEIVAEATPLYVKNMAYKSSLGLCSYTGEVDENDLPNGHGIATWESGEGKIYDGEWVHGKMEGKTKYTHRSGDTFVGTFKNNQYSNGKYTISSTGEYFEGSFKNGQPNQGKWYNKNGKEI